MEEQLILRVDQVMAPQEVGFVPKASSSHVTDTKEDEECNVPGEGEEEEEEEPLIQSIECRICQEEDSVKNLEAPCACSGSLKVGFLLLLKGGLLIIIVMFASLCCKHNQEMITNRQTYSV